MFECMTFSLTTTVYTEEPTMDAQKRGSISDWLNSKTVNMLCLGAVRGGGGTGGTDVAWWLWTALTWIPVLMICTFFVPKNVADIVYFMFAVQLLVVPVFIIARSIAKKNEERKKKSRKETTVAPEIKRKITTCGTKIAWIISCPVLPCLIFVPYLHLTVLPQVDQLYNSCFGDSNSSCSQDFDTICRDSNIWHKFPWASSASPSSNSAAEECLKMKRLALELTWILPVILSILRPGPIFKKCFMTKAVLTLYSLVIALEAMTLETYILNSNIAYKWEKYPLCTVIPVGLVLLNTELLQHVGTLYVAVFRNKDEKGKDGMALKVFHTWNCCVGACLELMFIISRLALTLNISVKVLTFSYPVFDWWIIKDALMFLALVGTVVYTKKCSRDKNEASDEMKITLIQP